jgi:hypothetical protein
VRLLVDFAGRGVLPDLAGSVDRVGQQIGVNASAIAYDYVDREAAG